MLTDQETLLLSKLLRRCKASDLARVLDDEKMLDGITLYDALCRVAIEQSRKHFKKPQLYSVDDLPSDD